MAERWREGGPEGRGDGWVALHAKPAVQRSVWWLMNVNTNVNVREDGPEDGLSQGCLHEDVLELLPCDQLCDPIIPLINRGCWQGVAEWVGAVSGGECDAWGERGGRVDGWDGVAALAAPSSIGEARRAGRAWQRQQLGPAGGRGTYKMRGGTKVAPANGDRGEGALDFHGLPCRLHLWIWRGKTWVGRRRGVGGTRWVRVAPAVAW